ncbi:hypothetical protein ACWF94_28185, partial [Streptomyces sp. NPDC055078]
MRGVVAASVLLLPSGVALEQRGGVAAAAVGDDVEVREPASSVPADDAGRGKEFWQDDPLPAKSEELKASEQAAAGGSR